MDDPLRTYIQDHLAGASLAVELLTSVEREHDHEPLGRFAAELLVEVEEDRSVLKGLADRLGIGSSPLKESAAWISERLSRLKFRHESDFGTFELLEALALGIAGKLSLWRALATVAPSDDRLHGLDFEQLIARAESQHARVEERRLQAARTALCREE